MPLAKLLTNCAGTSLLTNCSGNSLLKNCPKMEIRYTWTGSPGYYTEPGHTWNPGHGWDLFTETTFLGTALGWYAYGNSAGYLTWNAYETPNEGGYEICTVNVEKSYEDGAWGAATATIDLKADWWSGNFPPYFPNDLAGDSLTITAAYNGITRTLIINPSAITVLGNFVIGPVSMIVTHVGTITIDSDGNFTLV